MIIYTVNSSHHKSDWQSINYRKRHEIKLHYSEIAHCLQGKLRDEDIEIPYGFSFSLLEDFLV
jgi:hypothetical protein